jgi:hypothetical protein
LRYGDKIVAVIDIAAIIMLGFAGVTQHQQVFSQFPTTEEATTTETNSSADLLNAEAIYESNNITTDSDVENLVIVIPDSSLSQYYGASPSSALFQGFLPGSATVVRGTNVTWINADVNVTHGIILSGGEGEATGQIFEEASIPYQNGTSYMFDEEGEYTFAHSISGMTGTITVVKSAEDDPRTNVTRPTVGLMAVPAYGEARFSPHLNRLGFNAVSSFWVGGGAEDDDTTAGGSSIIPAQNGTSSSGEDSRLVLYVWSQEESDAQTVINRFASKLRTLEGILYPGGEVKQS